jgi:hypothetical protein
MSKKFYKSVIDDVKNKNYTEKAWFELSDFGTAKQRGITQFTLIMEKQITNDQEQWVGIFTDKNKELRVLGSL